MHRDIRLPYEKILRDRPTYSAILSSLDTGSRNCIFSKGGYSLT